MNTLKPLLIVAVLAGIGYGVYVRINSGNDAPPPGVAEGWDAAPKVQLPETSAPPGTPAWIPGGGPASSVSSAPSFGAAPSAPEPYTPPQSPEAQPYTASTAAAQSPTTAPAYGGPVGGQIVATEPPPPGSIQNPYVRSPNDPGAAPPMANRNDPAAVGSAPPDPRGDNRYPSSPTVGGTPPMSNIPVASFAAAMETARRSLEAGQMSAALEQLSPWHEDTRLSASDRQQVAQLLDQIAGTVVYSTQHLLEPPYEVQPGERLEDIGQRYNVPWQLLAKINGIDDPQNLRPGERLKVIRGPFSAVVSLDQRRLTLLLNGMYAGSFAVGIGREHPPQEGSFAVSDKVVNPVYHGRNQTANADDPNNPLGERWIGLGSELGIHGTNHPENISRPDLPGSITLTPRDVEDVYDILSVGSKVIIRR